MTEKYLLIDILSEMKIWKIPFDNEYGMHDIAINNYYINPHTLLIITMEGRDKWDYIQIMERIGFDIIQTLEFDLCELLPYYFSNLLKNVKSNPFKEYYFRKKQDG